MYKQAVLLDDGLNPPKSLSDEERSIEEKSNSQETLTPSEERKWASICIEREVKGYVQQVINQFRGKIIHIKCLEAHVNDKISNSTSPYHKKTSNSELPPLEKPVVGDTA